MRGAGIAVACVAMVLFAVAMQMPQYTALESMSIDDALKQPATDHIMESPQTHLHMAALSPHSMTAGTEQQIHEWHEPKSDLKIKAAHADEDARAEDAKAASEAAEDGNPLKAVKGKLFDGWLLKPVGAKKGSPPDADPVAKRAGADGGGKWWQNLHFAAPPAGWHRPKTAAKTTKAVKVPTRQKLSKDESWAETTGEKPNQFRGKGADASPITIEDEIKKGLKPYGDGIDKTSQMFQQPTEKRIELKLRGTSSSMSQKKHQQHRSIRAVLMDERKHPVPSKGRK